MPLGIVDDIAHEATEMTAFEDFATERVLAGATIVGLYPPTNDDVKVEYASWRAQNGR